jgi:hypothetical protein
LRIRSLRESTSLLGMPFIPLVRWIRQRIGRSSTRHLNELG